MSLEQKLSQPKLSTTKSDCKPNFQVGEINQSLTTESQEKSGLGRDLWRPSSVQPSVEDRALDWVFQNSDKPSLNIFSERDSTSSLVDLFQGLIVHMVIFFSYSQTETCAQCV